MRILIAGATGAIGRPLVRCLRANQHEVFALTRSPDSAPALKEIGAEVVAADALDAAAVKAAVGRIRPDAVIKLCGLSTGCTIDPLPHPWRGNNVYNSTGHKQTIEVSIDNGEGVRFWIRAENDGALADTISVQGCQGNTRFMVNKVLLGKHKEPEAGVTNVTDEFKDGTMDFSFPPASQHKHSFFTLNIVTQGPVVPVKYTCTMTVSSQADPNLTDTLVAKMTMY